jgi:SNF2 family DNA or RNA helicase
MGKRSELLNEQMKFQSRPTIAVTNYEALDYPNMRECLESFQWDACILDEGHRIKDPGGKRSQWLGGRAGSGGFSDSVPCRLELTGTKEPNDPLDIFAQARFLDRSYYGTRFTEFRAEYAILGPTPNGQIVRVLGYKNEEDLAASNFQFCIEVDAEDVQDLPEEHHVNCPVVLSKKTRKQYDEFWEEFVLLLEEEGDEVTAANVLVKVGKAQEITGGFIRNPDTQVIHELGTEKRDMLKEKLADLPPNEPVVVFYRLRPDCENIAAVCDELKRPYFECSGRVNQLHEWQVATGNEVLVCQISSGKEGVDLTRSRWAFYYSLGYQPGEFKQSKKRQIYDANTKKQSCIDRVRLLAREVAN